MNIEGSLSLSKPHFTSEIHNSGEENNGEQSVVQVLLAQEDILDYVNCSVEDGRERIAINESGRLLAEDIYDQLYTEKNGDFNAIRTQLLKDYKDITTRSDLDFHAKTTYRRIFQSMHAKLQYEAALAIAEREKSSPCKTTFKEALMAAHHWRTTVNPGFESFLQEAGAARKELDDFLNLELEAAETTNQALVRETLGDRSSIEAERLRGRMSSSGVLRKIYTAATISAVAFLSAGSVSTIPFQTKEQSNHQEEVSLQIQPPTEVSPDSFEFSPEVFDPSFSEIPPRLFEPLPSDTRRAEESVPDQLTMQESAVPETERLVDEARDKQELMEMKGLQRQREASEFISEGQVLKEPQSNQGAVSSEDTPVFAADILGQKTLERSPLARFQKYTAETQNAAIAVAQKLDFIGPESPYEHPSNMCGPLAATVLNESGLLPENIHLNPSQFWLANPQRLDKLLPEVNFEKIHIPESINNFDFRRFPLKPGDFLYLYGGSFEHMLTVAWVDPGGRAYAISNYKTKSGSYIIGEFVLYDPENPEVGVFKDWSQKSRSGTTGQSGFYLWRIKSPLTQNA